MNTKENNIALWLWMLLIVLLAAFLRFYKIGEVPLDNGEARIALEAFQQENIQTDTLPVIVNSVLFWFFGASNTLARFFPAIAGCILVLLPFLFHQQLTTRGTVMLSAALALEPGLVAVSRLLDGRILGIVFFCCAIAFLLKQKLIPAGIALGLFLLSGRSVGYIITLAGVVILWTWVSDRKKIRSLFNQWHSGFPAGVLKQLLISFLLTFILVGSGAGFRLTGISAAFGGMAAFFQRWIEPGKSIGLAQIGIALLAYGMFPLIFGLWGLVGSLRRGEDPEASIMLRWLIVSLVLLLIFPGRHTFDLIWILLPLWWFSAKQINRLIGSIHTLDWLTVVSALFLFVLICFLIMNWASIINVEYDPQKVMLRWAVIGGTAILIILIFILLGYGWGLSYAVVSFTTAIGIFLLIFQVMGGAWKSMGLSADGAQVELWQQESYPRQLDLMTETIDRLGVTTHGDAQHLEVVLVGADEPALRWAFRNYNLQSIPNLNPGYAPEVVISSNTEGENWNTSYRGQDFVYRESVNWPLLYPKEWQQWLLHRNVPLQQEWTILWARTDLFPGSDVSTAEE